MTVKPTENRRPRTRAGVRGDAGTATSTPVPPVVPMAAAPAPDVPVFAAASAVEAAPATVMTSAAALGEAPFAPVAAAAPVTAEPTPAPVAAVPEVPPAPPAEDPVSNIVTVAAAPPVADIPVAAPVPPPARPAVDPSPARPAFKLIANPFFQESSMATAFETTQETVKTNAEAAMNTGKAAMEQITAKSREAVENGMKSLDELTDMARGNVEALMASARTAAAGIEQIASHIADVSRKSFEEASTAARAMTAAKTPNELMQLQSDYSKSQFDVAVAEFSKLSELMVKLAGEVMEPMQNRIAIATDKMKATFTK